MPSQIAATVAQAIQDPKIWGETYGFWTQTAMLGLAALFAFVAIISARRIERKKSAIEIIFESRKDDELTKALRMIAALHEGEQKMESLAKKEKISSDESKAIRYALNHFESVAVSIAHGIFDEGTFKSSQYSTITRLYERTKSYIQVIRTQPNGTKTFYQEFECLACRWLEKPLKHKPIRSVPVRSILNFFGLS